MNATAVHNFNQWVSTTYEQPGRRVRRVTTAQDETVREVPSRCRYRLERTVNAQVHVKVKASEQRAPRRTGVALASSSSDRAAIGTKFHGGRIPRELFITGVDQDYSLEIGWSVLHVGERPGDELLLTQRQCRQG